LTAFLGAAFIGGTNFVAVKYSNDELDPMFGAALRFAAAATILYVINVVLRLPLPRGRAALGGIVYGLLGFGVSYAFLYIALVGLSPGVASVLVAGTPLFTLGLAVLHRQEKFSARGLLGGLLAITGIAVLSSGSLGGDLELRYLLAALLGVIAIAESSVLVKAYPKMHPVTTNTVGMAAGTILLAASSLVAGETWALPQTGRTWFVLAWLVAAGSVGLFVLFLFVIGRWTASASVYAVTLMPVVAVTLSAFLGQDELTIGLVLGGALVIAAVYIGAISGERKPTVTDTPDPLVVAPGETPAT
jgi:drug/metabolite transporter (DMT)-like permease